jgi:DNA-binding NtrC family response regulator
LSEPARRALVAHAWPGNVRELRNRIQRALLVSRGESIRPEDLGLEAAARPAGRPGASGLGPDSPEAPAPAVSDERAAIEQALREAGGMVSRAAGRLGLSRQALYRRMEKLGIAMERRPKE